MSDQPIDLRPLDPDLDPMAESRFAGGVMARVSARAGMYPLPADPMWGVWSMARPVMLAAAVVLVVAGAILARKASESDAPLTVAESVGVPLDFQMLMASSPTPSPRRPE